MSGSGVTQDRGVSHGLDVTQYPGVSGGRGVSVIGPGFGGIGYDFAKPGVLPPPWTYTRAGNASQALPGTTSFSIVGTNTPAWWGDTTKARFNIVTNSANPGLFTGTGGTIIADTPDVPRFNPGAQVYKTITGTDASLVAALPSGTSNVISGTNAIYTCSARVWIPAAFDGTIVRLATLTLASQTFVDANMGLRDQWQTISVTGQSNGTTGPQVAIGTDVLAGRVLYSTAWQIEQGATATPYILTTAGATCDMPILGIAVERPGTNSLFNPRGEGQTNGIIGSGGVMPTRWLLQANGGVAPNAAMTMTLSAGGTEYGFVGPGVSFVGDGSTTENITWDFENVAFVGVAWSPGQPAVGSVYFRIFNQSNYNNGGVPLQLQLLSMSSTNTVLETKTSVYSGASAFVDPVMVHRLVCVNPNPIAGTVTLILRLTWQQGIGPAFSYSIRVAYPQIEQGYTATTPILPTAGTPAISTRAADNLEATGPIAGVFDSPNGLAMSARFALPYTPVTGAPNGVPAGWAGVPSVNSDYFGCLPSGPTWTFLNSPDVDWVFGPFATTWLPNSLYTMASSLDRVNGVARIGGSGSGLAVNTSTARAPLNLPPTTQIRAGQPPYGTATGGNSVNGFINQVRLMNRPLANTAEMAVFLALP